MAGRFLDKKEKYATTWRKCLLLNCTSSASMMSLRLFVVLTTAAVVTLPSESKRLGELATVKCDGRGSFVVALEFGLSLVGKTSLTFDVKACQFVVIALTETVLIKQDVGNYILTILGMDNNTKSVIKDSCFNCKARRTKKKKVLDCDQFLPFWMSWDDAERTFMVGEGEVVNERVLLKYARRDIYPLYFLQLTSAGNVIAEIKLYKEDDSKTVEFLRPDRDGTTVISVEENTDVGTDIFKLAVKGEDNPEFQVTTEADSFKCEGHSLVVTRELDYEKQNVYFVTIRCGGIYAGLTVKVIDINDNSPVISPRESEYLLLSNTEVNTTLPAHFRATDADHNDTLTFKLVDVDENQNYFVMDEDGMLKVVKSPIEKSLFRLSFTVTDLAGHTDKGILLLKIRQLSESNTSDCPPTLESSELLYFVGPASDGSTAVKVKEDSGTPGTVVYTVKLNRRLSDSTLQLEHAEDDFYLDNMDVKLSHPLNYKKKPFYTLKISVIQKTADTVIRSLDTYFNIEVVPKLRLEIISGQTGDDDKKQLLEELSVGFVVGYMEPAAEIHKYKYRIRGPGSNYLDMNEQTGEVTVGKRIDRDRPHSVKHLSFVWEAVDVKSADVTISAVVDVDVVNVNDNFPYFSQPFYKVNVLEDEAEDKVVLELVCTDLDEEVDCGCTVGLSHEQSSFQINGTKLIAKAHSLWFERENMFRVVEVVGSDCDGKTANTFVFVKIRPRNDFAPKWIFPPMKDKNSFLSLTIPRQITQKLTVTVLKADDEDRYTELSMSLLSVTSHPPDTPVIFSLDSETGELCVTSKKNSVLSPDSYFTLNVSVSDEKHSTAAILRVGVESSKTPQFDRRWYVVSRRSPSDVLLEFDVTPSSLTSEVTVVMSENNLTSQHGDRKWVRETSSFSVVKWKTKWRLLGKTKWEEYEGKILLLKAVEDENPQMYDTATVIFDTNTCQLNTETTTTSSTAATLAATSAMSSATSEMPLKTSAKQTSLSPLTATVSASSREWSASTHPQHTSTHQKFASTHQQSTLPHQQSTLPAQQITSTHQKSALPDQQITSTYQQTTSKHQQSTLPDQHIISTYQQSTLPDQKITPTHQQSALPNQQTVSTHQQSTLPDQQTTSKHQQSTLPDQHIISTYQQSTLPDQQTTSTHQQSTLPDQKITSTHQQSTLPNQQSVSTHQQSTLPDQQTTLTPKQSALPDQQTASTPKQSTLSDQQTSTPKQSALPDQQTASTPKQSTLSDQQTTSTPKQSALQDQQTASTPKQSALPDQQTSTDQQSTYPDQQITSKHQQSTSHQQSTLPDQKITSHQQYTLPHQQFASTHQQSTLPDQKITSTYQQSTSQVQQRSLSTMPDFSVGQTTSVTMKTRSGGLVIQFKLYTDMPLKDSYNEPTGTAILSEITNQLTAVFSTVSQFDRVQVHHLVNENDKLVAKYVVHFSDDVSAAVIDELFQTLEKKHVIIRGKTYNQSTSAECTDSFEDLSPNSEQLFLKLIAIVEGLLLMIAIACFVIVKTCFRKHTAVEPSNHTPVKGLSQRQEMMEKRIRELETLLDSLDKENIQLKTSGLCLTTTVTESSNTQPLDHVVDIGNQDKDVGNDDTHASKSDTVNDDSAYWSPCSRKSDKSETADKLKSEFVEIETCQNVSTENNYLEVNCVSDGRDADNVYENRNDDSAEDALETTSESQTVINIVQQTSMDNVVFLAMKQKEKLRNETGKDVSGVYNNVTDVNVDDNVDEKEVKTLQADREMERLSEEPQINEDIPISDVNNSTKTKLGDFGDVVVDALRFKYLLDDEEQTQPNIPVIYTRKKEIASETEDNSNCVMKSRYYSNCEDVELTESVNSLSFELQGIVPENTENSISATSTVENNDDFDSEKRADDLNPVLELNADSSNTHSRHRARSDDVRRGEDCSAGDETHDDRPFRENLETVPEEKTSQQKQVKVKEKKVKRRENVPNSSTDESRPGKKKTSNDSKRLLKDGVDDVVLDAVQTTIPTVDVCTKEKKQKSKQKKSTSNDVGAADTVDEQCSYNDKTKTKLFKNKIKPSNDDVIHETSFLESDCDVCENKHPSSEITETSDIHTEPLTKREPKASLVRLNETFSFKSTSKKNKKSKYGKN